MKRISPLQWHSLLEVEDSLHLQKKKTSLPNSNVFFPKISQAVVDVKNVEPFFSGAENPTGSWIDRNQPSNVHLHQGLCWKIQRKLPFHLKKIEDEVQGHPTWLPFKKQLAIKKLESSFLLRAYSMIPAFQCALFFHPSWEKPVGTSAAMLGNQLSVSVLSREKSTNHCQTWTWWHAKLFSKCWRFQHYSPKTERLWKPRNPKLKSGRNHFFTKFSTLWLPAVEVESTVESSRKNRALHFIRSVGEGATSENSRESGEAATTSWNLCISCVYRVCVCVYMCIYIYTVYTDTPHESTKNMYISDIRFLLLAATSANLQSWNMLFVFPIISCTKERQNIGSRSLWVLSGLSIKN